MSQPSGIALNNSHLLRAALAFAVLGVIGPGLLQLQPPQWLGAADAPAIAVVTPLPDIAENGMDPDSADVAEPATPVLAAASEPAVPSQPAAETGEPAFVARSPSPDGVAEPKPMAETKTEIADAQAGDFVAAKPAPAAPVAVVDTPGDIAGGTASQPEQPAVVARKAKQPAASITTQVASVSPRVAVPPSPPKQTGGPIIVARDFVKRIPEGHVGLPVKSQKESFVAMTLPLILAANEEISQRRSAIKRVVASGSRASVERWAKLYKVKTEGRSLAEIEKQLLLRADFVPVSLALAQAAIESGWGTSRFALQGNALFGQWAWQKDAGLKPAQASNANAVVRSFPNLFGSVRAYMHNLNTHPRYAAFRARRHLLRGRSETDLGYQLSNFMDGYAEIGEVYVGKLKTLIRSNDFGRYETARLS